jgi:hypothetical protein
VVAVLQGFEQEPGRQSGLADAGRVDEHDVLGFGDEVELGEAPELLLRHAGLALPRKRLEGPLLRQSSALDAPPERGLLAVVPLGAQELGEDVLAAQSLRLGMDQFYT